MTNLYIVYGDGFLSAAEVYCGDVKYVESFSGWKHLLAKLTDEFQYYAYIEINSEEEWKSKAFRVIYQDED